MRPIRTWLLAATLWLAAYAGISFCVVGQSGTITGGAFCGDGVIQEEYPTCWDNKVDFDEWCDVGTLNGVACNPVYGGTCTFCSESCETVTLSWPDCGDSKIDAGESCDDGNTNDADGCNNLCQKTFCGDGILQAWESCDNGSSNGSVCTPWYGSSCSYCSSSCSDVTLQWPSCGNNTIEWWESCDDGNTRWWDGCSATCVIEPALLDTGVGTPPPAPIIKRTSSPVSFGAAAVIAPAILPSTGPKDRTSGSQWLGQQVKAKPTPTRIFEKLERLPEPESAPISFRGIAL